MSAVLETDQQSLVVLREYADHSSAFLTFNDETSHFVAPGVEGLVAYREAGRRHLVQLCGPIAEPEERPALLDAFLARAAADGRRVTAVQVPREDAPLYAERGFTVDQMGCSFSIDLDGYALRGQKFVKTRNMISRARREGATVDELDHDEARACEAELAAIDGAWLAGKGRHVHELAFMIGERGGRGQRYRRLFVARAGGRIVAYVSFSPVFGERPGWLYDLTRRDPEAPPGVIELIFFTALERFQEEGWGWMHLGFTPFVGLDDAHDLGAGSGIVRWAVRQLAERGELLYPARTQESFKRKWLPHRVEPEYLAFQGGPKPGAVFGLLRVTRTLP